MQWTTVRGPNNQFQIPSFIGEKDVGNFYYDNPTYSADAGNERQLSRFGFMPESASKYGDWGRASLNGWGSDENYEVIGNLGSGDYDWVGKDFSNNPFGLMIKTGDKAGTVIPYKLVNGQYVPDLGQGFMRELNTTGGDVMRGLASVALAGVSGGALGTTAQTAAQAYQAANAANNAYQAYQAGNTGAALSNAAGAVSGAAGLGGYTDLANYAKLAQSGVNAYNAYENENIGGFLSAIGSGMSTYNKMGTGTDMEENWWANDPYDGAASQGADFYGEDFGMYDSGDPYNSDPVYTPGSFPTTPNDPNAGFNWGQFGSGLSNLGGLLARFTGGGGGPRSNATQSNQGGGGFDLGSLLAAYYGSQAAGDYADQVRGIAANMRSDAAPYLERLARSYTNPNEYLESPEMQARLGLEANKYAGIDAASGRLSNDIDRTKKLQDYGMAALGDYRRGLQGSISSVYRPEAIANLYRDAAGRETSRYGGYSRLVGNQGGGPNTGGSGGFGVNDLLGIINQGGDLIGDAWDWISDWWDEE